MTTPGPGVFAGTPVQLRWCEAEKSHRDALRAFICTDPPRELYEKGRGRYHPTQYEYDVQSEVHKLRPRRMPERQLLGFDEKGILRAVITYVIIEARVEDDELVEAGDQVFVRLVACDQSCRGQGLAAQAYAAMFADLASLGWVGGFEVEGNIHSDNDASKRAFARAGAKFDSYAAGGYEIWKIVVP